MVVAGASQEEWLRPGKWATWQMRGVALPGMIDADTSTNRGRGLLDEENPTRNREPKMISGLDCTQATLAVCGDPVTCRALVLLLRAPGYDVGYLPTASLSAPGSLAGVQVLLLASERDAQRRKATLELVSEATAATEVHVLELSNAFEVGPEQRGGHDCSGRKVPWPCSTEKLKLHIEDALWNELEACGVAHEVD